MKFEIKSADDGIALGEYSVEEIKEKLKSGALGPEYPARKPGQADWETISSVLGIKKSRKKCPFCAEEIQNEAIKCKHCGEMLPAPSDHPTQGTGIGSNPTRSESGAQQKKRGTDTDDQRNAIGIAVGVVLGFALAYLLCPEIPLLGRHLPIGTIISRGSNLQGLDSVLVPMAETSFNYVLFGSIIGGTVGFFIAKSIPSKS